MGMRSTLWPIRRDAIPDDLIAGLVVGIMLVPQAIAYAYLAGLPPEAGIYSSLFPLLAYALLGTSPTLAVGPVAIISLMTLSTLQAIPGITPEQFGDHAILLAAMTGLWLWLFCAIGLGTWASFISHSVVSGFTSAAALVIILSQLKSLTGVAIPRDGPVWTPVQHLLMHGDQIDLFTLTAGLIGLFLLIFWQRGLSSFIGHTALPERLKTLIRSSGPLVLISSGILLAWIAPGNMATVGAISAPWPSLSLPDVPTMQWQALLLPSAILALIIFLESLSIANAMARSRHQRPAKANQELLALGGANLFSALSHGMPVAGGFGRSMVMMSSNARSQWATVVAVLVVALLTHLGSRTFDYLPEAALGALIIGATWPLFRWQDGWRAWQFQRSDGLVWLTTFILVLGIDAINGILAGVIVSLIMYLRRTSQPHIAEVGRLANSQEQFRNVLRHDTRTVPGVMLIRVDENLYFANGDYLIGFVLKRLSQQPDVHDVVLIGSAINHIDFCGLEALEHLQQQLADDGKTLHLADFKGPVMDQLKHTEFLQSLRPGQVFFTTAEALSVLSHPRHLDDDFYVI